MFVRSLEFLVSLARACCCCLALFKRVFRVFKRFDLLVDVIVDEVDEEDGDLHWFWFDVGLSWFKRRFFMLLLIDREFLVLRIEVWLDELDDARLVLL